MISKRTMVISGVTVLAGTALVIWGARSIAVPIPDAKDVWAPENRILLSEHIAPDSSRKIGVYQYDAGALGYTTLNVSLVGINEDYPIEANLFKTDKVPASVEWTDSLNVVIRVDTDYAKSQARSEPPGNERKGPVSVRYEFVGKTN